MALDQIKMFFEPAGLGAFKESKDRHSLEKECCTFGVIRENLFLPLRFKSKKELR